MNRVNFNSLSAYKAPEKWLDQAAAIPETCEQKKRTALPIYRVAAAASLVLVSVIGLLTFLIFGDSKAPIAIRGKESVDILPTETDSADPIPDDGSYPSLDTVFPTIPRIVPTDAEGRSVIEPSTEPDPAKEKKASATEPTAAIRSTQHSSMAAESALKPSREAPSPTVPSTEYAPVPTEAPVPTAAPSTDPPLPPATEPPLTDCRFTVTVKYSPHEEVEEPAAAFEADNPIVFCRMYDASGDLVGSSSSFAEEKRATVVSVNPDDSFVVTYDPLEKGLPITRGRYTYVMVDCFGTELCRGTVEY